MIKNWWWKVGVLFAIFSIILTLTIAYAFHKDCEERNNRYEALPTALDISCLIKFPPPLKDLMTPLFSGFGMGAIFGGILEFLYLKLKKPSE